MSDYELLHDVTVGTKPKESKDTEGAALDHSSVAKAVEHGRPDALGARGAMHLQRLAGNAATGAFVQRDKEESPVKDVVGKGGGSPLPDHIRKPLEAHHKADLGSVRLHTDSRADQAATSVQSLAFTSGDDIAFKSGQYKPDTKEGLEMLAHETAHVVQQRGGPVDGTSRGDGTKVSDPSDRFERAAVESASAFSAGIDHAGHDHGAAPAAASASVQRDADDEETQAMHDPSVQREADDEETQAMHDPSVQRAQSGEEEAPEQADEEPTPAQGMFEVQREESNETEAEEE